MSRTAIARKAPAGAHKCSSCGQVRPGDEMIDDVCADCVGDLEDAAAIAAAYDVDASATRSWCETLLRQMATEIDGMLPFTIIAFGTLSSAALALLHAVHPDLDVAACEHTLRTETRHAEDNASELAAFIRSQLEVPTLRRVPSGEPAADVAIESTPLAIVR